MAMLNCFSVDVEEHFQVQAFASTIPRAQWDSHSSRVVSNTQRIMELMARHHVRGTFFVLGCVAERHPRLIQEIVAAGHELASHGYGHDQIYNQTPDEFREDLRHSVAALGEASGLRVTAYRAPSFSITARTLWAIDILIEEGFTVDSSIFPVHHDNYGIPDARPEIHAIEQRGGTLWEFPPTIVRRFGRNLPVSGGGWFRLYPYFLSQRWLRSVPEQLGRPFMFYIHPWEVDPDQPRMPGPWKSRFRHYQNLKTTLPKLTRLMTDFRLGTLKEVLAEQGLGPDVASQPGASRQIEPAIS